jgi:glucose-1-phosphate cytidylyltransferase
MKAIILAGGRGTRLAEETTVRPKPMVEIGGRPILWHIMKIYASHGYKDFVVACGYKGELIKQYFSNFLVHNDDYTIDLKSGSQQVINKSGIDWRVTLIDTGLDTMTGGRLRRLKDVVGDATFMATYGDGVGNVDVTALVAFHKRHGKMATVTAVRPPARFGELQFQGDAVASFSEKPQTEAGWINGGYFVFEPGIFDYLADDSSVLEREPMERLARDGQLIAFRHPGFWQPMDTLREKELLEQLWASGKAPWKTWQS